MKKLLSLFVVSFFFTLLFLGASFTGNVAYEGLAKLSDEYNDVTRKEVHSCHDRTTFGVGQVRIVDFKGHLRTVFISDFCTDEKTLRVFACKWENNKHYLISKDVDCVLEGKGGCRRDRCR